MTLAHELCHLLFDTSTPSRQLMVSPNGRVPEALERLERVARAFAACFLAPTAGVRQLVKETDPTSDQAIARVGREYGVGRTVAINRLQHVFGLSDAQRVDMTSRAPIYACNFSADEPPSPLGFRGATVRTLVHTALRADVLSTSRARRILMLDASEPLPFPDLGQIALAPLNGKALIMRRANQYLAEHRSGFAALDPQPSDDGHWQVPVAHLSIGTSMPSVGTLTLNARGEVVHDDSITPT